MRTPLPFSRATRTILLVLALLIVTQPMLVASQLAPATPRPQITHALTDSAERYINSLSAVSRLSTALIAPIEAIRTAPPDQLTDTFVAQTRQLALDLAVQAATAIGATDDFAAAVAELGDTLPPAINIEQTVAAGLPAETRQDFIQIAGLSATQVDALNQGLEDLVADRLAIASDGLPAETVQALRDAGFSQGDIDTIAQSIAGQGIADTTATTRLDQFRATKWELGNLRSRALIMATQMLVPQVAARQAQQVAPQPVAQDDLTQLADDQLRLLTHIKALQAAWGSDPSLDRGEGHWWFIERYAQRAGERIDQIILTAQNPAFTVDAYIVHQLQTLAITARAGDPASVKGRLDNLAKLLTYQLGKPTVLTPQARGIVAPTASPASALRDVVMAPVDVAARAQVVAVANTRLAHISPGGAIVELHEGNNTLGFAFPHIAKAGYPLDPEVTAAIEANFDRSDEPMDGAWQWFWGIVTGETDNWTMLTLNFVLGVIPVIGVIPDLATLATSNNLFLKALAVVGIIGSLGDILALVPGLQPVGASAAMADGLAGGFKALYRIAATKDIVDVLNHLTSFDSAFKIATGLIEATGKLFIKELNEIIRTGGNIVEFLKGAWRSFDGLVKLLKTPGRLVRVGVTVGGLLAGQLEAAGKAISDGLAETVIRVFDDIFENPAAKNDEVLDGLSDAVEIFGEQKTRLAFASCFSGALEAVTSKTPHVAKLTLRAAPVNLCEQATTVLKALSEQAQAGLGRKGITAADIDTFLVKYGDYAEEVGQRLNKLPKGEDASRLVKDIIKAYDDGIAINLSYIGKLDFNSGSLTDFELNTAKNLVNEGGEILGLGDDGVRRVFGLSTSSPKPKAADLISITSDNKLRITEVKDAITDPSNPLSGMPDAPKGLEQLRKTAEHFATKFKDDMGFLDQIESFELAIPQGKSNNLAGGYYTFIDTDGAHVLARDVFDGIQEVTEIPRIRIGNQSLRIIIREVP